MFKSGLTGTQDFEYKIRMGVIDFEVKTQNFTDMMVEGKTEDLFDRTIISVMQTFQGCGGRGKSFVFDCVEERYKDFVLLQSMIDSAYIRLTTNDKSFLPSSEEELCTAEMVMDSDFHDKKFIFFL